MAVEKRSIENADSTRAARKALEQRSSSFKISKGQAKAAVGNRRSRRAG
jgi:hypothetical protein